MAKILFVGTFGTDDPTRASMPFVAASGALDSGHEPQIWLLGESSYLLKAGMIEQIHGVGFPPLKEVFQKVVDRGVPITV